MQELNQWFDHNIRKGGVMYLVRAVSSVCVLSLVGIVAGRAAQKEGGKKVEKPPVFKEYVSINIKSNPPTPVILQHAKVKQLGDRTFVVGTPVRVTLILEQPKARLIPDKAFVRWIALAEVVEMYEFDDVKGYLQLGAFK
jgi:hypothetical protein